MSKKLSEIGDALSIMNGLGFKALIRLKNKAEIICKIGDFDYSEDDSRVILLRCEETVFPGGSQEETCVMYLKNIASVDRYRG